MNDEVKSTVFTSLLTVLTSSSPIAPTSSFLHPAQISAGELFELLRPAAWVLATLISAWVLSDTRRRRLALYASAAWTLSTLFFPLIVLPIYLIIRAYRPSNERATTATFKSPETIAGWQRALPIVYALLVLSLLAFSFVLDYRSVDAHLARANRARLVGQREQTIKEYRAALKLEDDPHTHNLLARELTETARWDEALEEFRAAERGHEPDEMLAFHLANTLEALKRPEEASLEYQKFLASRACTQELPDTLCDAARARLLALCTEDTR